VVPFDQTPLSTKAEALLYENQGSTKFQFRRISEFQKYSKDRVTAARSIPVTPELQAQYLLVRESLPLPKWVSRWGLKKIEPSDS
jgi:hypothetical protein